MLPPARAWVSKIVATCLVVEAIGSVSWIARILSVVAIYDAPVLAMVGLRSLITALQFVAAARLWQGADAGPTLAQAAFVGSAVLLALEIGFDLAPSSVIPGLEWPIVGAYALYAALAIGLLRRTTRHK